MKRFGFYGALEAFRARKTGDALQSHYSTIPGGKCDSCGACCYDNVPLSAAEFLAIVDYLDKAGAEALEKALSGVTNWYRYQFERVSPCVFLGEDKRCGIYEVRPLVCRLFGHQTPEEQARRIPIVLEQNKALALAVKEAYNIDVAQVCIDHVIRQCDFVPDTPFEKAKQDALFEAITQEDTIFYQEGHFDLDYINLSLIEWFVLAFLDEDILLESVLEGKSV